MTNDLDLCFLIKLKDNMNDDLSKKENLINGDIQGPGGYKCGKRLIEVEFFFYPNQV